MRRAAGAMAASFAHEAALASLALRRPVALAALTLGALARGALALGGCQQGAQRPACPAGKVCLEYGNDTEPLTLDPQRAELLTESLVIGDLMMGLTTEAADGTVIPGMA